QLSRSNRCVTLSSTYSHCAHSMSTFVSFLPDGAGTIVHVIGAIRTRRGRAQIRTAGWRLRPQGLYRPATDGRFSIDITRSDGCVKSTPNELTSFEWFRRERTMRQRWHIGPVLREIFCLCATVAIATFPATAVAQSNPIVVENQQPGSGAWWWTKLAD